MITSIDDAFRKPSTQWRTMPLSVFLLGLLSVVVVLWVGQVNEKQRSQFVLTNAVMDLQIHASTAHLWLEEALTAGPRHVDMEELWREFDRAIAPSETILSGGLTHHGPISDPLYDPALRSQAESIRFLLMEFKTFAAGRLKDSGSAGIGTVEDKRYNILFREILKEANALEHSILENELRSHARLRLIFRGIVIVWSFVVLAASLGLWNREVRHDRADLALRKATEELEHRVQERTAELSRANERLLDERNNLKSILDSMNNGVHIVNQEYEILYINPVLQKEFGPIDGKKCHQYFSGRDHACPSCELWTVLAGKTVQREWHSEKNGKTYDLFAAPIKDLDGGVSKLEIFHDVTLHKQARDKVRNQLERLSALRSIDLAITSSLDLRVTLGVVIENAMTLLHADAVSLLIKKPRLHVFEYAAGRGFRTDAIRHSHVNTGRGYAGRAAHSRKLLAVPDIAAEKNIPVKPPFMDEEGFHAYFGAPMIAKGGVIGVLEVYLRRPFTPDGEWTDFLEALAGQAAIAADNANLFNDLQRSNDELIMAYDSTLEGWARALDYRDKETEGHSRRVTDMTVELARTMGLPEEEIVHIKRGALLHDIGKLGVPDGVLLKPGKLSDAERKQMERHPRIAYELISPVEFLRPAIDIPFCHHEKWDGSGYPRGLKAGEIPFSARIFSVVDVWDALRSERPYRTAWPVEKVTAYLRSRAGIDFDPRTVGMFLKHLETAAADTPSITQTAICLRSDEYLTGLK
jgi:PAS domain-containing protein